MLATWVVLTALLPSRFLCGSVGKKLPDYWDSSKKLLNDANKFLDNLLTFERDNIPDAIIKKIESYIAMEEFTPEAVAKVSKACTSICMWVRAMHLYHTVSLSVSPESEETATHQLTR